MVAEREGEGGLTRRIAQIRGGFGLGRRLPAVAAGLLLALLAGTTYLASAHPITVGDDTSADWLPRAPLADNTAIVARDATEQGEYLWKDAAGDESTALNGGSPDPDVDIREVRYTGDSSSLFVLVKVASISVASGANAPQIQLAIDKDRTPGSGSSSFVQGAETDVADSARSEYVAQTRFGSGNSNVALWESGAGAPTFVGSADDAANGTIELSIPWASLGLAGPLTSPLRFTVASFRSTSSDGTVEVGGAIVSNALDVVTDYGDPGTSPNTTTELGDQRVDYYADVTFNSAGEVRAPVVISSFASNIGAPNEAAEWIEVANASPTTVSLSGFKLGDSKTPDEGASMYTFPTGTTLVPGGRYLVARSGSAYNTVFGSFPQAEFVDTSPLVPNMDSFAPWGTPPLDLADPGDVIALLDDANTTVDAVPYGTGSYTDVNAITPAPAALEVQARALSLRDTDDADADFGALGCSGTKTWTGAGGNNSWFTAANWSGGTLPGPTDHVCIPDTGLATISFASNANATVASLTSNEKLTVVNGTLTLDPPAPSTQPSTVSALDFSGGVVNGDGDLNVTGTFNWTDGEFQAPATTVKVTVGGLTTIGVNTDHNVRFRRLDFNGGTTWNAGRILVAEGASIRNPVGQTFLAQSGNNVQQWFGATSSFVNGGTFTKAGAGTVGMISGVQFNNSGSASVDTGTLQLEGGTSTGSFAAPAGSTLVFNAGTSNLNAGSDISGAGALTFSGGTTNVSSSYTHTGPITLSGSGTAVFAAPLNGNTLSQSGGGSVLVVNATSSVASYTLTDGIMEGGGDLNVAGAFTWNGGEFRAPNTVVKTTVAGPTTIGVNTDHNIRFRRLDFNGGTTWNAGRILVAEGASIRNPAGQPFVAQSGNNVQQWFGATSSFVNGGTFTKAGAGTVGMISGVQFNNSGSASVGSGTLHLEGGTSIGSFAVPTGSALVFNAGTNNLNAGSDISGAGALTFSGGTTNVNSSYTHTGPITLSGSGTAVFAAPLNGNTLSQSGGGSVLGVNATSSVASYTFNDGLMEGSGDLNVAGAFTWNGGEFRAPNTSVKTTVAGPTTIGVNTDHNIRFRRLDFNGGTTWNAGRILVAEGASIRNPVGQTFLAQSGNNVQQWFGATSAVINEGTFTKAGAATVAIISGTLFHNSGSATVAAGLFEIQGGTSGGSFTVPAGSTLQFNGGTHNLLAASILTGAGTVRFANGTVNVTGAYAVTSPTDVTSGTVNFLTAGPLDETPATTSTLTQSGGVIGGDDTLQITGSYLWAGGTQTGSGQTLIDPAAALTIVGSDHALSGKRLLTTKGTTTWTSPGAWSFGGGSPAGATVRNSGTWTIGDGQSITNPGGERGFFNEAGGLITKIGAVNGQTANWSAEDGAGAGDGTVVAIPSWNRPAGSNMTVVPYGSAGFPTNAQAPAGAGNNFFAGGPTPGQSTITQIVELGGNAAAIDASQFSATLEGQLGGEGTQNDAMTVNVVFMTGGGGSGSELGRITLGPVLAADRGNATGFVFRAANGAVPAGTRSARLELVANNATGVGYNNAYADKIKVRFRDAESWLGSSNFDVPFDNDSTVAGGGVQIQHGTLGLAGGGADQSTGSFVVDGGAALQFGNGTHEVGSTTAGSISGAGTVRVMNGTVNVRAAYNPTRTVLRNGTLAFLKTGAGDVTPATTGTFVQSDGNIAGDDRFDIGGAHVWTGGGHFGSGETRLLGAASGSIDGGFKQIGNTRVYRNQGTVGWTGGDRIRMGDCNSPSTLRNEGTFNVTAAVTFEGCGGSVLNTGSITKVAGANTFIIGALFDNDGILNVSAGTVNMNAGGVDQSAGSYAIAAGTTLQFGGGSHTLGSASSVTGAGTLLASTGTATVNSATYDTANTTLTNGTLVMNTTGALDETPATTANYTQTDGTLSGNERLDISGNLAWSGGGQFGAGETRVLPSATGTFSGNFKQIGDTRTFRNQTMINWTGGDRIRMGNCNSPSVFRNEATLNVTAGVQFEACGGIVQNTGTIAKSAGANTFTISSPVDNDGTLDVGAGTVNMTGGGVDQSAGAYAIAAGTTLQFGGGNHTLAAASSVTGAGIVSHTSGTTSVNSGTYDVATTNLSGGNLFFNTTGAGDSTPAKTAAFNHSSGDLTGSERLDVSSNKNWTGGGEFGTGETRILPAATLAISGGFKQIGDTRVFRNQGMATWTSGDRIRLGNCNSASVFRNEGTLDLQFDSNFEACGGQVVNRGLVKKSAGAGISNIGGVFDNTDGTLEVATGIVDLSGGLGNYNAGTRTLDGGTYIVTGQLRFPAADVATNAATVVLNTAASSVVDRNNTTLDGFRNFATNAAAGDFTIKGGRNLFTAALRGLDLTNHGILRGTGIYFQHVTSDGTVAPGASIGLLTINGNYTQTADGHIEVEVGKVEPPTVAGTDYDRLHVTGTASLAGSVDGVALPSLVELTNQPIDFLTAGVRTGAFTATTTTPLPLDPDLVFQARNHLTQPFAQLFMVPRANIADVNVTVGDITDSGATINVTLTAQSEETVTVNYTTADGTALAGLDYTETSGVATFVPGDTSESFLVPILPDGLDEIDETFLVNLTGANNAEIGDGQATVTITDDDIPPTLSVANVSVTEGDQPGTTAATFTLNLNGPSGKPIEVTASTADGTAHAPDDYVAKSQLFTFDPGQTQKTFTVDVVREELNESDEAFAVGFTSTTPLNVQLPAGPATGTILDDDTLTWRVNDVSVNEGGDAVFTVTINRLSDVLQQVTYSTGGGNATAGTDYTVTNGTLQIPAGSLTGTITVPTTEDATDEVDETFNLTLSGQTEGNLLDGVGLGTIDDDDGPSVSFTDSPTVLEGDAGSTNARFNVSISTTSVQPVSVNWTATDGTAAQLGDYGPPTSGMLTIPSGETTGFIDVPINGDVLDEADETFTVTLSSPVDGTVAAGVATGTINDDDGPAASVLDKIVAEGDTGSTNALVRVQLSATSPQDVSVHVSTADGSATALVDYAPVDMTLTIPAGQPFGEVAVPITGDNDDEASETVLINIDSAVDGTIGDNQGVLTIDDDDGVGGGVNAQLSIDDVTVTEGDAGTTNAIFTVTVTGTPAMPVSVGYSTADGTATAPDYTTTSGTLMFGETTVQTITVPVKGERLDEGTEQFSVNLSSPAGASLTDAQGVGTISDDDSSPVFNTEPILVLAEDPPAPVEFELPASDADEEDVLVYQIVSNPQHGTLTGPVGNVVHYQPQLHYNGFDSFSVRVSDGTNADVAEYAVQIEAINDPPIATNVARTFAEDTSETLTLPATDVDGDPLTYSKVAETNGTVTISSNEATFTPTSNYNGPASFTFKASDGTVDSNVATAALTVTAVNDAPVAATDSLTVAEDALFTDVDVLANDNDVDEDTLSVTAVSDPLHGTTELGSVRYKPDPNYAGPDTFTYTLSDGQGGEVTGRVNVTVTPANDPPVATDDELTVGENTPGEIDVLGNDNDDVDGDTLSVTAVTDGTKGTPSITVEGKVRYVPDIGETGVDTFDYTLSDGHGGTDTGAVVVTIIPAGEAGATLVSVDDDSIVEGHAGEQIVDVTVELTREATVPVEVRLSTNGGSASGGVDYGTLVNRRVDFAVGEQSHTVPVKVNGDTLDEADETFSLVVSSSSGAGVGDGSGEITITDDDPAPSLSIGNVNVTEGNSGSQTALLTVTLSAASGKTVAVDYATADETATQPSDYTQTSGQLTFAPGETSKTIPVSVHGDTEVEISETLTVVLSNAANAGLAAPVGTLTIVNDDSLTPPPPPPPPPDPPAPTADLALTMSAPATSAVDRDVTYNVAVRNNGPSQATGVVVTDALPAGLELVSANVGQVACSGAATVVCPVGTLAVGATAAVTIVATTTEPGVHTNTASVSGAQPDPSAGNNAASATTRVALPVVREATRANGCTQRGTAGNDVLRGGPGVDILCGFGGNDVLVGFGGNDKLLGGAGNDRLLGGAGNDNLKGANGRDELLGGAGNDRLDGGRGRDNLAGGRGDDVLFGSFGDDFLSGGKGKDRNLGGPGKDRMRRDAQDTSLGGPGGDQCVALGVVSRCP